MSNLWNIAPFQRIIINEQQDFNSIDEFPEQTKDLFTDMLKAPSQASDKSGVVEKNLRFLY